MLILLQNGGLFCDANGQISKPFPDKPYCQSTTSNIGVVNNAGGTVAFCQTVLPGNEAMLIPTSVDSFGTLAVPGTDYWAGTAAHYYINPPGTSAGTACVWGTNSNPWGNWSPYVAGANADSSGQVFIKLGWNPIYLETTTPFRSKMPSWGVSIDCPNGGCSGLPCAIDSSGSVNSMNGGSSSGAGGGNFCVVTVPKGVKANFVVNGGGSSSASIGGGFGPKGGQFYQSTTTSQTTTMTTTTSSSTTISSTTTTVSRSRNATTTWASWTSTSSTASSSSSATTTVYGPTGQPYYSLFNTTLPQTTDVAAATGPLPSGPSAASATIAVHTGSASSLTLNLLALAPLALWTLF